MEISNLENAKIIVRPTECQLVESFVDYFESNLKKRLIDKHAKPLGLATGRTMEPIYKSLVTRLSSWPENNFKRLIDGWRSFNLDEYVGLDSKDNHLSFKHYMYENLAEPIGLDELKIGMPDWQALDPYKEAEIYSARVNTLGGIGLQILGLGTNGHIGFNEPTCNKDQSCRVVSLSVSTRNQNVYAFQNNLTRVPSQAITLGLKEILNAEEIHLIVTGSAKAKILNQLLRSSPSPCLPASFLCLHPSFFLWADTKALGG